MRLPSFYNLIVSAVGILTFTAPSRGATVSWIGGNGSWSDGSKWDTTSPPAFGDTVLITVPGSAVAINVVATVGPLSIGLGNFATLLDGNSLRVMGSPVALDGVLSLSAGGNQTDLLFSDGTSTLVGTGALILAGGNARVYGGTATDGLVNQALITGFGQLGVGNLQLQNQNLINADSSGNVLYLNATTANAGTLQASAGGVLAVQTGTVTSAGGGVIQALDGSAVYLINNGTLENGTIQTAGSGWVGVPDGNVGRIKGALTLVGQLSVNAAGNATELRIDGATSLQGGGALTLLGGNARVYEVDNTAVLTNHSTINGFGQLGVGLLNLVNATDGVIAGSVAGQLLYLNATTANAGTLQASAGGVLAVQTGTVTSAASGVIQALDGSAVYLINNGTLENGTIQTTGSGWVGVPDGNVGRIKGALTLVGQLSVNAAGNATELRIDGATSLQGSGALTLLGGNARVLQWDGAAVLTNHSTINGFGQLGVGALNLVNAADGVIAGSAAGQLLYLNAATANAGTLQASGGGVLAVQTGTVTSAASGVIQAMDGSAVYLINNGALENGTIQTAGSGWVGVPDGNVGRIKGALTLVGQLSVNAAGNATELRIDGATSLQGPGALTLLGGNARVYEVDNTAVLTNHSTINGFGQLGVGSLNLVNSPDGLIAGSVAGQLLYLNAATANAGTLQAAGGGVLAVNAGTVTSTGGGVIEALDGSSVYLINNGMLENGTIQTEGSGSVGVPDGNVGRIKGALTLVGQLSVNAAGNLTDLRIDGATSLQGSGALSLLGGNARVYEVDNTAVLTNHSTINGFGQLGVGSLNLVNSPDGVIAGSAAGQFLYLNATTANAGTLQASGGGLLAVQTGTVTSAAGGVIEALDGSRVFLINNGMLENGTIQTEGSGSVGVPDGNVGRIKGALTLVGQLSVNAAGNLTDLRIDGATSLQGAGALTLLGGNARVYEVDNTAVLTNHSTINGFGQLGVGSLNLVNATDGVIAGSAAGQLLYLNAATANAGTLQASGGGVLAIQTGTVTSTGGGVIEALGGSSVYLINNGMLENGTIQTAGSGWVGVPDGNVGRIKGALTLVGQLSVNAAGNLTDLRIEGATSLQGPGALTLLGGNARVYEVDNTAVLTNHSTINGFGQLGVGSLNLVNATDGVIAGSVAGQLLYLNAATANAGTLQASGGGLLAVQTGTVTSTGGGVIQALDGSAVYLINNGALENGTIQTAGSGWVGVPDGNSGRIKGALTLVGQLSVNAGGNLTDLRIDGATSLQGPGALALLGGNARVYGFNGVDTLDNASTINGFGQLGLGSLELHNSGVLHANVPGQTLTVSVTATIPNSGLVQVTDGAIMRINTGVDGSGIVSVQGGGSRLVLGGSSTISELNIGSGSTVVLSSNPFAAPPISAEPFADDFAPFTDASSSILTAAPFEPVPEPATLSLILSGLLFVGRRPRRIG